MFALTFDTDWAHQAMIDETISLLDTHNISATFFITNKMNFENFQNHELAIHPHFTSFEHEDIISKTIDFLPSKTTKGSRSHKLYHSSSLMMSYKKFNIEYDSNYFLPSYNKIEPFFLGWTDVLEIPFFFADDAHYEINSNFELSSINVENIGTKVFLFHPFHVFMNTSSMLEYNKFKKHYDDISFLKQNRDLEKNGIRTMFLELLDFLESHSSSVNTMAEINQSYRSKHRKE